MDNFEINQIINDQLVAIKFGIPIDKLQRLLTRMNNNIMREIYFDSPNFIHPIERLTIARQFHSHYYESD